MLTALSSIWVSSCPFQTCILVPWLPTPFFHAGCMLLLPYMGLMFTALFGFFFCSHDPKHLVLNFLDIISVLPLLAKKVWIYYLFLCNIVCAVFILQDFLRPILLCVVCFKCEYMFKMVMSHWLAYFSQMCLTVTLLPDMGYLTPPTRIIFWRICVRVRWKSWQLWKVHSQLR